MPLLDHHRPPVKQRLPWPSLHSGMLTELTASLNARLPEGFVALDSARFGPAAEIDIATYDERSPDDEVPDTGYEPPPVTASMPFEYAAATELRIYLGDGAHTLVAAIKLVSPSNKDRPGSRRAYASKVADYLYSGISVVVLDAVTDRYANLHDELVDLIGGPADLKFTADTGLNAVAHHPQPRAADRRLEDQLCPRRPTPDHAAPSHRRPVRAGGVRGGVLGSLSQAEASAVIMPVFAHLSDPAGLLTAVWRTALDRTGRTRTSYGGGCLVCSPTSGPLPAGRLPSSGWAGSING